MITTRLLRPSDLSNIVNLYNRIVDGGGYALTEAEFNRHITEQDWLDWESFFGHTVQLVFEQNGAFFGFCALSERTRTEAVFEHLGVFQDPVPVEVMWQIVDWLKANTVYITLVMDTADLTNVGHFNDLADILGASTDGTLRRKVLAEAQRPQGGQLRESQDRLGGC